MLGRSVRDPDGIEGKPAGGGRGRQFWDLETVLVPQKTVLKPARPVDAETQIPLSGYEIHMGRTSGPDTERPMIHLDGRGDGAISSDGRVRGSYLHGLFASDRWRRHYLGGIGIDGSDLNYREAVEHALDDLADQLEQVIDPAIFDIRV